MTSRLLLLLLGLLLMGAPVGNAQDAPSLEELKTRYDRLQSLRASFTQVIGSEFADDSTRIRGRVVLADNKYRVQTPSQTVVTDGETTWIYSPADSQVVVNDAGSQESTVTPQTFLTASTETYRVESTRTQRRNGSPHAVLSLHATQKSAGFREATLWMRTSDRIVTRLRVTDRNGSTLDLRLQDIVVNAPLDGTPFTFSAPQGVEVVDLRSEPSG